MITDAASIRYFNDEDKVGYSEEYAYDEFSRVAQIHTRRCHVLSMGSFGSTRSGNLPDGSHISYEYDQQRNLTKLVRSDGLAFEFCTTAKVYYQVPLDLMGYTANSNTTLWEESSEKMSQIGPFYTAMTMLAFFSILKRKWKNIVENHFNYTLGGRLTLASNRHQTLQYQYSSFGHLTKRIQGQFEIGEEFNRVGQRISQTLPDKTSLNFSYDTNGRLSEIRFSNDSLPKLSSI